MRAFEKWYICEPGKGASEKSYRKSHRLLPEQLTPAGEVYDGRKVSSRHEPDGEQRAPRSCRKNYLFCGNHDAAEDAAVIYFLMGCCKEADVDFKQWINYFLNHVHDNGYSKNLANLLPHSLKEQGII